VPQGICKVPTWFIRIVLEILKECTNKDYAVIFIDNILIDSDMWQDHIPPIDAIIDTLQKKNFELKD
jgi:hypothetical protein